MVLHISCPTPLYTSLDPDDGLNFSSSSKNIEDPSTDFRLWITQLLLKLNVDKINIIYLASSHYVKSLKDHHYRWARLPSTLIGQGKILDLLLINVLI